MAMSTRFKNWVEGFRWELELFELRGAYIVRCCQPLIIMQPMAKALTQCITRTGSGWILIRRPRGIRSIEAIAMNLSFSSLQAGNAATTRYRSRWILNKPVPSRREHPTLGRHSPAKRHKWARCYPCAYRNGFARDVLCMENAPAPYSSPIRSVAMARKKSRSLSAPSWDQAQSSGSASHSAMMSKPSKRLSGIGAPIRFLRSEVERRGGRIWSYKLRRISRTPRSSLRRSSARRVTPSA